MNVYSLLDNVEEKPTMFIVKRKKAGQCSNLQNTHAKTSQTVAKMQELLQSHSYSSSGTIKITKEKNVTIQGSNMMHTAPDEDLNNTWDSQISHIDFNFSSPYYSRVKLMADQRPYKPQRQRIAIIFHISTPRFNKFFQRVDNRISKSPEYLYVSMHIYSLIKNA